MPAPHASVACVWFRSYQDLYSTKTVLACPRGLLCLACKHRNCQAQDPAFAFGCVAFGCVWIHSAFAAFAFGCVLRLGVLRLPAFGSGSAFAAFSTSAFGPRVHHSAFGMILRLRLAAFAFGCVCVWLRLGHPAFGCVWRSQHSPGRIASWLAIWLCGAGIHSARQPDSQGEN